MENKKSMEAKSPGAATSGRKPVLTGSVRKLKDNAADWHNLILKWNRLNEDGSTIASQIVNLKFSKESEKPSAVKMDCDETPVTRQSDHSPGPNKELEEGCNRLLAILEKMSHLLSKMEKLSSLAKGVCALETFQQGKAGGHSVPFQTWPTEQFDLVSSKLYESYTQELALKRTIVQEVAHTSDPDLAMVYLSSWLYQPYLEDSSNLLLESMLLETGHRPL